MVLVWFFAYRCGIYRYELNLDIRYSISDMHHHLLPWLSLDLSILVRYPKYPGTSPVLTQVLAPCYAPNSILVGYLIFITRYETCYRFDFRSYVSYRTRFSFDIRYPSKSHWFVIRLSVSYIHIVHNGRSISDIYHYFFTPALAQYYASILVRYPIPLNG